MSARPWLKLLKQLPAYKVPPKVQSRHENQVNQLDEKYTREIRAIVLGDTTSVATTPGETINPLPNLYETARGQVLYDFVKKSSLTKANKIGVIGDSVAATAGDSRIF